MRATLSPPSGRRLHAPQSPAALTRRRARRFDPDYSPNDSDAAGRYSYRQQPAVSAWNLRRLATALAPLGSEGGAAEAAAEAEAAFWVEYEPEVRRRWRSKLGLLLTDEGEADDALLESLLGVMQRTGADFTNTFRALSRIGWEASEAASYRAPQVFDAVLEHHSCIDRG